MNLSVLLVDDEVDFVEALAERLEARGIAVAIAHSGAEALEKVRQTSVDVVVLDVVMPGLSGIDTLRQLKQQEPLVEVLMLTGHATVETAIQGMKHGAFDYLLKPTEADALIAKLEQARARKAEQEDRIRQAELLNIVRRRGW